MKPTETGKAYDQITHLWQRESFNRQNGIAAHEKALGFAQPEGSALDIGCGCTGRFLDLLVSRGYQYSGLDVSAKMIELARQRNPDVCFYHEDICEFNLTQQYDFITAWDSIWHIPLDMQKQVLNKIIAALNPGGVFIFTFGGTEEAGDHQNKAMGPEVYYSSLGLNGFLTLFMDAGCIIRHLEFDQHPELHTYLIVEKAASEQQND